MEKVEKIRLNIPNEQGFSASKRGVLEYLLPIFLLLVSIILILIGVMLVQDQQTTGEDFIIGGCLGTLVGIILYLYVVLFSVQETTQGNYIRILNPAVDLHLGKIGISFICIGGILLLIWTNLIFRLNRTILSWRIIQITFYLMCPLGILLVGVGFCFVSKRLMSWYEKILIGE